MKKRILIALGGTGGHVFPALAFARELNTLNPSIEMQFIGGKLNTNHYFDRNNNVYHNIACGKWNLKSFGVVKESFKILQGCYQTCKVVKAFRPDLTIGFGSYHSFPALLASKMLGIPLVLYESNSIPGRVVKFFSAYAQKTAVFFPIKGQLDDRKVTRVKMPLRGYRMQAVSKHDAQQYYNLSSHLLTILVFGGSQGAKAINAKFADAATALAKEALPFQVIHLTGNREETKKLRERYRIMGISACVKDFEENMDMAWRVADIVISRAGASSIAEQIEYEVPGLLIPYPHATDNHQLANACFLEERGMSLKRLEADLTDEHLSLGIKKVITQLAEMQRNIQVFKAGDRAPRLSELILDMLKTLSKR
ncbi:MAG: UDP-N-acetylglucosamine--N-acetylmuramyl-(pentapeptide) pyrophosphoryl-undecaprenol N-acetylglucosamine transferase [Parachlamydiaceae bacterium]